MILVLYSRYSIKVTLVVHHLTTIAYMQRLSSVWIYLAINRVGVAEDTVAYYANLWP